MTNLNSAITDGDLDQVSGGMDCKTALLVAGLYESVATIAAAAGNAALSSYFSGKAAGLVDGGCPK
jgi:hypothetical protein